MNNINFLSGSWTYFRREQDQKNAKWFTHDLFTSGDYVGCTVQASNRKVLLENTELCERLGIELLCEAYSTETLLFPIESLNDSELQEIFESLENYPCLDEQALSEIESELERECFDCFGRRDFQDYLLKHGLLTEEQSDDITSEQLDSIYFEASRHTNYNIFEVESGTSGHFDFESFGSLYNKAPIMIKPIIDSVLGQKTEEAKP